MVLDMIGAPAGDPQFAMQARGKILKAGSMVHRRYELKYANYPYKAHRLYSAHYSSDDKRAVARDILEASWCNIDVFIRGIRTMFGSIDKLMSPACARVIRSSLDNIRVTTDLSERHHAEMQAVKSMRGQAPDFEHFSRTSIVNQARTAHMHNGGSDPLRPDELLASTRPCTSTIMPFFAPTLQVVCGCMWALVLCGSRVS